MLIAIFWALYGLVFIFSALTCLLPIANPDLFWHLASARKAQELGQLFLSTETFSFTKHGSYWINYEWLFQKIVFFLHRIGDFRLLAITCCVLVLLILLLSDFYIKREFKGKSLFVLRLANLIFVWHFVYSRANLQPELFSLLFLIIFFFLRDRLLYPSPCPRISASGAPGAAGSACGLPQGERVQTGLELKGNCLLLTTYYLLFVVWANIHGGFVWPMAVLGIQIFAQTILILNERYKHFFHNAILNPELFTAQMARLKLLVGLFLLAFSATIVNPYGFGLYKVIIAHLHEGSFFAQTIDEWQATQFYQRGAWLYWVTFFGSVFLALLIGIREGTLLVEESILLLGLGYFTAAHIRNLALFGIVCLPIFWRLFLRIQEVWAARAGAELSHSVIASPERSNLIKEVLMRLPRPLRGLAMTLRVRSLPLVIAVCFASRPLGLQGFQVAKAVWHSKGLSKNHVALPGFPELVCQFVERNPDLLKLKTFAEWGWGGYMSWRLSEKGLSLFFDGRYIFVDLLQECNEVAQNPLNWDGYTRKKGMDVQIVRHDNNYHSVYSDKAGGKGRDLVLRNWITLAIPKQNWALVWWDNLAVVFVRRDKMPKAWIAEHEYASRFAIDPFWVTWQVRRKEINIASLLKELKRNSKEVGWNARNYALLTIVQRWQRQSLVKK